MSVHKSITSTRYEYLLRTRSLARDSKIATGAFGVGEPSIWVSHARPTLTKSKLRRDKRLFIKVCISRSPASILPKETVEKVPKERTLQTLTAVTVDLNLVQYCHTKFVQIDLIDSTSALGIYLPFWYDNNVPKIRSVLSCSSSPHVKPIRTGPTSFASSLTQVLST